MPEVVAAQSGPQGRASDSWDILATQNPSPPELGERPETAEAKEPAEEPTSAKEPQALEPEAKAEAPEPQEDRNGQEQQEESHGKKESRYERTKRQRKAFEAEREKFEAERVKFAEERRALEEQQRKANEPPYTLKELKGYRKAWADPTNKQYDPDLAEKADAEIARLEELEASQKQTLEIPTNGTPEFLRQWEAAEKELYQVDPEFQREGTRLDKVLRAMMSGPDGQLYRQHPRGIIAAYHRARLAIAEADLGTTRGEVAKLKNEITRLNGLLGIGGGATGGRAIGEFKGKDFASLSTKEMREHLKRNATVGHW
jgi:chemotaxis protein histidine kinase CheA